MSSTSTPFEFPCQPSIAPPPSQTPAPLPPQGSPRGGGSPTAGCSHCTPQGQPPGVSAGQGLLWGSGTGTSPAAAAPSHSEPSGFLSPGRCPADAQPTEAETAVWNQVNAVLEESQGVLAELQSYTGAGQEIREVGAAPTPLFSL